jgi:hypothetical protein
MQTVTLVLLSIIGLLFLLKVAFVVMAAVSLPVTNGALFVPTSPIRIKALLDTLPMKRQALLVDLGCGDGRILVEAQKRYGVRALGFEVNPLAYLFAKIRTMGRRGVEVRWQNFWKSDFKEADVVFCYLFPDVMKDLGAKLRSELPKGARVASCNFPIPGWHPSQVVHPESDRHNDPIYIYHTPASWCSPKQGDM